MILAHAYLHVQMGSFLKTCLVFLFVPIFAPTTRACLEMC